MKQMHLSNPQIKLSCIEANILIIFTLINSNLYMELTHGLLFPWEGGAFMWPILLTLVFGLGFVLERAYH